MKFTYVLIMLYLKVDSFRVVHMEYHMLCFLLLFLFLFFFLRGGGAIVRGSMSQQYVNDQNIGLEKKVTNTQGVVWFYDALQMFKLKVCYVEIMLNLHISLVPPDLYNM